MSSAPVVRAGANMNDTTAYNVYITFTIYFNSQPNCYGTQTGVQIYRAVGTWHRPDTTSRFLRYPNSALFHVGEQGTKCGGGAGSAGPFDTLTNTTFSGLDATQTVNYSNMPYLVATGTFMGAGGGLTSYITDRGGRLLGTPCVNVLIQGSPPHC
ncbi:MAG: hypothetical protein ACYDAN_14255 [Candidatus Limnocylindrales bacterium]